MTRHIRWALVGCLLAAMILASCATQPAAASDSCIGSGTEASFLNVEAHHDGHYELCVKGTHVAATFTTTRSPVTDSRREAPLLFTVPERFRPPFPILRLAEGQPVQADGSPVSDPPISRSFLLQIDPDGAVRYAPDAGFEELEYLAYTVRTAWGTTPAANDRAVLGILDEAWFGTAVLSAISPSVWTGGLWAIPVDRANPFVSVNIDRRVTALGAPDYYFSGELRPELGELHHLEHLDLGYGSGYPSLHNENFYHGRVVDEGMDIGSIPPDTGSLTGSLPPQLGQLTHLRHLDLSGHLLSGEIPAEFGNLTNLDYLNLRYNLLSGPVPPEIVDLPRLKLVDVQFNQLTGCVPWEWRARGIEVHSHDNDNGLPWDSEPLPFCWGEAVTMVPDHGNVPANWQGRMHLEVRNSTVFATIRSVRSPVQNRPQTQPGVVFTVPEELRSPNALTWVVGGHPVWADGTADPARDMQLFSMSMDTAGRVRYVDEPGLDDAGHFGYQAMLAWPLADTEPQVCERSQAVQTAVLASLNVDGTDATTCADITWMDLSTIQSLEIDASNLEHAPNSHLYTFLPDELAGLSSLRNLRVYNGSIEDRSIIWAHLPERLLDHAPLIQDLNFSRVLLPKLSSGFLNHVPNLRSLSLTVTIPFPSLNDHPYPEGFLTLTPQLKHVELHLNGHVGLYLNGTEIALPPDFLSNTPNLQVLRMYVDGETWSGLPSDFLADTPNLEVLTVEILGEGSLSVPSQFLSHSPRLKQARIWVMPVDWAETPPVLVVTETDALLSHAPSLEQLWLQRVNTGLDLARSLPDTTQVYWSPRETGFFPVAETLALGPDRHWLYVLGSGAYNPATDSKENIDWILSEETGSNQPLNMVVHVCGDITSSLEDWLARHTVRALTLISTGCTNHSIVEKKMVNLAMQKGVSRLSLLTGIHFNLLSGGAFDWLHIDQFGSMTGMEEAFQLFSAKELLLGSVTALDWLSQGEEDWQVFRTLVRTPRVQHLGLVLELGSQWFITEGWLDRLWTAPPGLLDDLGFECISLDLRSQREDVLPASVRASLTHPDVDVQFVPGVNGPVWRGPWISSPWDTHWSYWSFLWNGIRPDRLLWYGDSTWFEEDHLTWAREQECSRSLYLRFQLARVSLGTDVLSHPGDLRHMRVLLPTHPCQDCPNQ